MPLKIGLKDKKGIKKNIILRKKYLCLKTEIQITKKGKRADVLETVLHATHDFTFLKNGEEFLPPSNTIADSEYQGIKNFHKKVKFPIKNKNVENSLGKIKSLTKFYRK